MPLSIHMDMSICAYTVKNQGTANSIYRLQIVRISPTFAMYPK